MEGKAQTIMSVSQRVLCDGVKEGGIISGIVVLTLDSVWHWVLVKMMMQENTSDRCVWGREVVHFHVMERRTEQWLRVSTRSL